MTETLHMPAEDAAPFPDFSILEPQPATPPTIYETLSLPMEECSYGPTSPSTNKGTVKSTTKSTRVGNRLDLDSDYETSTDID